MENKKIVILNEDGTRNEKAMAMQEIKDFLHNASDIGAKALKKTWDFTMDNKENLMFLVGLGGAAATAMKKIHRSRTYDDQYKAENSIYDPVTHTRFWLRRPLTNRERVEYLRRTRNGEYADDVLESMGVLL